jgi:RNA polymerase sigma-70 factor (ECF subfamily)
MTRLHALVGLWCMETRAGGHGVATEPEAVNAVNLDAATELRDFVSEHHGRLIRLAALVTRSVDGAEDAVQAAFERAWRHRASLSDRSRLRPWLDRIVVREAIRGARRPMHGLANELAAPFHRDTADESAAVHQALDQLAPGHRAVVVLHLYAGYPVADTAAALGIPIETARSRLRVARDRLRHLLAEEG